MIKALFILFSIFWAFGNISMAQDSLPDPELQRKAAEEAKIREEILKNYRVDEEGNLLEQPATQPSEIKNDGAADDEISNALEKDKDSFLSGLMPDMMNGIVKKTMQDFLKENPLSKLPPEEVKSMIMVQVTGKPMEKVFKNNPRLLDMIIEWLRDPKAIPALIGLLNKQEELKTYSISFLVVFILSFILNLMSKGSLISRIFKKLLITIGAIFLNLGIFYWLFKTELTPTIDIVFKYI